jgi:hypothetical protein
MPTPAAVTPAAPAPQSPFALHLSHSATRVSRPSQLLAARETPMVPMPVQDSPSVERPEQVSLRIERPVHALPPVEPWVHGSMPAAPAPSFVPPTAPSALARESRLIAQAIAKLRLDGRPEEALAILDQRRAELSSGPLAHEATATRIEALLKLGRNGEAQALLDAQYLTAKGVDREMLVARAELRADKGSYAAALRDFDALLAASGQTDSTNDRALYGRATCRAKSGDWEGARRDFEGYVALFPHGRFVEQVRAALAAKHR